MKLKLITAHVQIGKSKETVTYVFHERDFYRIEESSKGIRLFLKDECRELKIDEETKRQIIFQMNLE